jgi:hypothetical protein
MSHDYGQSLVGRQIRECCIGLQVEMVVAASHQADASVGTIRISGAFRLHAANGVHELNAEGDKENLAPVLAVVGRSITASQISADGTLDVTLEGDVTVSVPSDEGYEAWEVRTEVEYLVCAPGGHVSRWTS